MPRIGLALEEPLLATLARHGYAGREAPVFIQSFETGNLRTLRSLTEIAAGAAGGGDRRAVRLDARRRFAQLCRHGHAARAGAGRGLRRCVGVDKTLVIPRTAQERARIADGAGR